MRFFKVYKKSLEWVETEFAPLSFIDVVFLLLIFFFLTVTAVVGTETGDQQSKYVGKGRKAYKLPSADVESESDSDKIDGVRLLVQKNKEELGRYEYYLLGYDNEDRDPTRKNFTEKDFERAKEWRGSLELDVRVPEDALIINEHLGFIHDGDNTVLRYGAVPVTPQERERENARIALFIRYLEREFPRYTDASMIEFEIKADENTPIGFITDIMTICGADSIPRVSFILKSRLAGSNTEG